MPVLPAAHVTVIPVKSSFEVSNRYRTVQEFTVLKEMTGLPDDLPQVFWGHVLLLSVDKAKLTLLSISLALQLLPLARLLLQLVLGHDRCRGWDARRAHGRRGALALLLVVHRGLSCLGVSNNLRCLLGLGLHLDKKRMRQGPKKNLHQDKST